MFTLVDHAYGKSTVRVFKVTRTAGRHDVHDLEVDVQVRGAHEAAYVEGDNSRVLPTDTMKNTIYALAQRDGVAAIESFGARVSRHLLDGNPDMHEVRVQIHERLWTRLDGSDGAAPDAFAQVSRARRLASIVSTRESCTVVAGVDDLHLMKTGRSAFSGFKRDAWTTLPDTRDRILATVVEARWRYRDEEVGFDAAWDGVRAGLVTAFADHLSESVQHTLYAMAARVLDAVPEVEEISLRLPNRHHLPVDLRPFGLSNANDVFVATSEPAGVIEATVRRGGGAA